MGTHPILQSYVTCIKKRTIKNEFNSLRTIFEKFANVTRPKNLRRSFCLRSINQSKLYNLKVRAMYFRTNVFQAKKESIKIPYLNPLDLIVISENRSDVILASILNEKNEFVFSTISNVQFNTNIPFSLYDYYSLLLSSL